MAAHSHADKKAKKKAQYARNRFLQEIFNCVRLRLAEQDRVHKGARKPQRASEGGEKVIWSAKTASVRDKLTGKRRAAKERWNRFAGTAESGGRGL